MASSTSPTGAPDGPDAIDIQHSGSRTNRRRAAGVCFLQGAVLGGFGLFYLVELARGEGSDAARVLTSALLILGFAAALAGLGRLWLGVSRWPVTPTVLWNVLLVPVTVSLAQAGAVVPAVLVGGGAAGGILSALAASGASAGANDDRGPR